MEDTKVALVVGAHPDDPEFGTGGTMLKWIRDGWRVVYVICTNGDKGSSDPEMTSEQLARIREGEQKEAAKTLGISEVEFLGYPDGGLEDTPEFRGRLVRLIRKYRPDIVLTHDPYRRYMGHRDHRIAGMATMDAVFPYSRDSLFYPEHKAEGLQPHKVMEVHLFGAEDPDTFVDISDVFEIKMKAVCCHVSQVGDHTADWETWLQQRREQNKAMSRNKDMPLSEAFKKIKLRR
jgi:LmbE family N-acetylglucosaminyl deacetylase